MQRSAAAELSSLQDALEEAKAEVESQKAELGKRTAAHEQQMESAARKAQQDREAAETSRQDTLEVSSFY